MYQIFNKEIRLFKVVYYKMCSIGLMTSDACKGQQDVIGTLSNEEKIAISLRCNIELSNITTLCEKHATNYLKMYPIWQKACCDPFKKHTKKITRRCFFRVL
ncbi:ARL14 effector protein-like [Hydra vulgaris]|uniref:ARL14 effector protein-like n=1 Tax=Hydra vulgaris TaxID=6087 RepID=A0ABM4BXU6_HYDVU